MKKHATLTLVIIIALTATLILAACDGDTIPEPAPESVVEATPEPTPEPEPEPKPWLEPWLDEPVINFNVDFDVLMAYWNDFR